MDATSKTRFHTSRRLKLHATSSTYSVVIISLGLILIALMQAYTLGKNINSNLVGLIQVFSSIAVLVYSLLIEKNNYSNLSEKMYSCASELGDLKQKLKPYFTKAIQLEIYEEFRKEYYQILKLYETHSSNDFRGDYFRAKLEMPEFYSIKGMDWWIIKLTIFIAYFMDFISYPIVLFCLGWVLWWLWFG